MRVEQFLVPKCTPAASKSCTSDSAGWIWKWIQNVLGARPSNVLGEKSIANEWRGDERRQEYLPLAFQRQPFCSRFCSRFVLIFLRWLKRSSLSSFRRTNQTAWQPPRLLVCSAFLLRFCNLMSVLLFCVTHNSSWRRIVMSRPNHWHKQPHRLFLMLLSFFLCLPRRHHHLTKWKSSSSKNHQWRWQPCFLLNHLMSQLTQSQRQPPLLCLPLPLFRILCPSIVGATLNVSLQRQMLQLKGRDKKRQQNRNRVTLCLAFPLLRHLLSVSCPVCHSPLPLLPLLVLHSLLFHVPRLRLSRLVLLPLFPLLPLYSFISSPSFLCLFSLFSLFSSICLFLFPFCFFFSFFFCLHGIHRSVSCPLCCSCFSGASPFFLQRSFSVSSSPSIPLFLASSSCFWFSWSLSVRRDARWWWRRWWKQRRGRKSRWRIGLRSRWHERKKEDQDWRWRLCDREGCHGRSRSWWWWWWKGRKWLWWASWWRFSRWW